MPDKVKVKKNIIDGINNLFKEELFRTSAGQYIFKQVMVPLPPTTLTPGARAMASIPIDQDSHFLCEAVLILYTYLPDLLASPENFIDVKIWNPSTDDQIMRDFVDVRALGFPWFHNRAPLQPKDKYYYRRGVFFPVIFPESTQINCEINYYHPEETTEEVYFIFRGKNILRKSLLTGEV
jgi:hypothetical protein